MWEKITHFSFIIFQNHQKMFGEKTIAIVLLTLSTICIANPCQDDQWWNSENDGCFNCTQCDLQHVVLVPCQIHKDAICGTISELAFDYRTFVQRNRNELSSEEVSGFLYDKKYCLIQIFFFLESIQISK